MKHLHFDVEPNGFYGAYWACEGANCAVIAMIGDDPEDRLARSAAKWLGARGVNILTMSPAKKDYGHHNYPLERIEAAISWLKANGNHKIGIAGASTTGTLALTAAAMFPDITLTIALTPSDFVWQGFQPVSYTHLDVYKRQIVYRQRLRIRPFRHTKNERPQHGTANDVQLETVTLFKLRQFGNDLFVFRLGGFEDLPCGVCIIAQHSGQLLFK